MVEYTISQILNPNNKDYKWLKEAQQKAQDTGREFFMFDGDFIDTKDAKYLVQAIENIRREKGKSIYNTGKTMTHGCKSYSEPYTWMSRKTNPRLCPRCKCLLKEEGAQK